MRIFLALISLTFLSACGFHPVYGVNKYTSVGVEEHLALINIGTIPNREGQYLRNALIDRFYRDGQPTNPQYDLSIQPVEERLIGLSITKNADTTRGQLRLKSRFHLKDKKTGEALLSRKLHAITSYNILSSNFSTRVSEDNARQNALDDLARQIEQQLALYFKREQ